jgi:uncharacterized membrane protein
MSRPASLFSVCLSALVVCACSERQAPPAEPAAEPAPLPQLTDSVAVPIPAESSLALKRGVMSLTAERATFQPCGDAAGLWVIDQTDGSLREAFANEQKPFEVYVEAHGERAPLPNSVPEASSFPGAFILEEVLYAAPLGEGQGCNAPAPNYIVRAYGNEPFWSIEITPEDKLIWRQPEEPKELTIDALQSEDAEGTVSYSGTAQGHKIELFVDAQPCRDSMSGAYFAYSARASFDGDELKGCARIGE